MLTGSPFGTGLTESVVVLEHLAGLLAIGLWAGQNGGAAAWQMPAVGVVALLAAGIAANVGVPLPYSGLGLSISLIAAGVAVAMALRAPPMAAIPAAAVLALFHGYMSGGSVLFWLGYGVGATLVMASGLGLTAILGMGLSPRAVQLCGCGAAVVGVIDLAARF